MAEVRDLLAVCGGCGVRVRVKSSRAAKIVACPRCGAAVRAAESDPTGGAGDEQDTVDGREADFRKQSLALGAVWILKGLGSGLLAAAVVWRLFGDDAALRRYGWIQGLLFGVLAPVWLAVGAMTCRRSLAAIRVGLILEYLTLVPAVAVGVLLLAAGLGCFGVFGAVISVILIRQAHRLLGWAAETSPAGRFGE